MSAVQKGDSGERVALGFGDISVAIGDHIAHFYRGIDERLTVLGPYMEQGLKTGDKCVFFSTTEIALQLCRWLEARGIDTDKSRDSGQLLLHPGEATGDAMLALGTRVEAETQKEGYRFVRACGDAGWSLQGTKRPREMLRWEAYLDDAIKDWKVIALCQIDLTEFGGNVVMDVMRCHGLCIMGELLIPNPFHLSPDTLIQELS
ncbi:MEDS domain-containing protein [bacterium]|nr:MEDS domain-containing protein [bacterium]